MAPSSSTYEDTSSFLFGLNHFASPAMQSPQSGPHGPSNSNDRDSSSHNAQAGSGLLTGFEAFNNSTPANDGHDLLEGGSFADELALWTNANFSFDGPTGHALLGDEDKEKDKDKDKDAEERRAGKRVKNEGANGNDGRAFGKRNGKGRMRDEEDTNYGDSVPNEPTHQTHVNQASWQQQQHYFAPPSSQAEEARRPGFDAHNSAQQNGTSNQHPGSSAGTPYSPYGGSLPNGNAATPSSTPQTPLFNGAQNGANGPVDISSLLAVQQLIASNPLALATLGNFSGLNPQLGLLGNQLNQLGRTGGLNQQNVQQIQQQLQQAQRQASQPSAQQNGNGQPLQSQYGFSNGSASNNANGSFVPQGMPAMFQGPQAGVFPNAYSQQAHHAANESASRSKENNRSRTSEDHSDEYERDNIPPLKLIDTGNPEADAEANRQAIEEDKRRRNTAASARFRVKKKQREAALESHAKELESQVNELREEISKLRNENQWLKGLIQVRGPESNTSGNSNKNALSSSSVDALQAAQQLQALQQAVSPLQNPRQYTAETRERNNGIHPRGVGTKNKKTDAPEESSAQKRDRDD